MKRIGRTRWIVLATAVLSGTASMAALPSYTLAVPGAVPINNTSDPGGNEWLAANTVYPLTASYAAATNTGRSVLSIAGRPVVTLVSGEAGFTVERTKPQYWLGEQLVPPAGVDWTATLARFQTNGEARAAFIMDPSGERVFVYSGGAQTFEWVLTDQTVMPVTYVIGTTAGARPYRIFWTQPPYNAPSVDLSGKFVKFFGPDELAKPAYGVMTNETGGLIQIISNNVVRGLYLDPQTKLLSVYGEIRGQVVMAYYSSGSYEKLQCVQVLEVTRPEVIERTGTIGKRLEPSGSGYAIKGLLARPQAVNVSDSRGDFYYQHQGTYSYSPKNGDVFALRPTTNESWRLPVYWMDEDAYGTLWPFELCHYACSWGADAQIFVRGDIAGDPGMPLSIPSSYTAELMKYQDPEGHAPAPADNAFVTTGAGYSLLKLTASDNVWFLPVHSVLRSDTNFFTLAEADWNVGDEIVPRGGAARGTAAGYLPDVDPANPGYLYKAVSGSQYDAESYTMDQGAADDQVTQTNLVNSTTAGDTNTYASAIFPVAAGGTTNVLEAWWSASVLQEGMSDRLLVPTLVQRYRTRWPHVDEAPQIVIASQRGSAADSVHGTGSALRFADAAGTLALPDGSFFGEAGGSLSFSLKTPGAGASGQMIALGGESGSAAGLSVSLLADGRTRCRLTWGASSSTELWVTTNLAAAASNRWTHFVFACSRTNLAAYVDGCPVGSRSIKVPSVFGRFIGNVAGASGAASAPVGVCLDELALWRTVLTPAQAAALLSEPLAASNPQLSGFFTFDTASDLVFLPGTTQMTAVDRLSGRMMTADHVEAVRPGAPIRTDGIIDADETPIVYTQNDAAEVGYNPNEEHAFVVAGNGGYVAWALRCDLNTAASSEPGVLVRYVKDGARKMCYFPVVVTNSVYAALAAGATAGTILPGPHPLDLLDDPWQAETTWDTPTNNNPIVAFRDRKRQVWSRCSGTLDIRMWYPMQDGFYFPSLAADEQPKIGTAVPWLSSLGRTPGSRVLADPPAVWTWTVAWPKNVETMRIGQTLTTAASGLPEVWNAKSVAVVYPVDENQTVMLYDPTVVQRAGTNKYDTLAEFLKDMGLKSDGADAQLNYRAAKYTFRDLPPSISDRLYIDSTLPLSCCLCLKGALESKTGGQSLLQVNVLNDDERAAIKAVSPTNAPGHKKWEAIIDALATGPVLPSPAAWSKQSGRELCIGYVPRDHYALTAMGATNYVVLIENDTTNALMKVDVGDAISMHVFAVTNDYYAGAVVARQDPLNLLSQQLSILYTESFAGRADDYQFEWKKASPNANGTIPSDYEHAYARKFDLADSVGLTRFILGGQGDTLKNLVNTYYVCRYRAAGPDTPAYAVMGDKWSDWCGPTLAEGWVQRVVNNITPFTQRMQDLYENAAETAATAIKAAGAPYQGDVAMNQDNLTSIGLIQLYQTLLNKAESMSLTLGVNDGDVNKQLLLATERLADMYVVLGNEAYADALNPTIGFGSTYGASGVGMTSVDYGAESSSLFCFDNQVSSLLDEELALLRGRTGENAPVVTTAPYYNRLVWNFTKGITAGEVAYAVNYNVNSVNGDAKVDEEDAAAQYPQGHGDAYGHYLSALSGYYRLLRNPYFSWGTVGMSEMLVNDAVVNVDYYDEERFAEIAGKLATTAEDAIDLTARKAWRDNGGVNGAGYLDENTSRNFGYGEWATRGGVGAVINWMVANSLLPEEPVAAEYSRLFFSGTTRLTLDETPTTYADATNGVWTFECQIVPSNTVGRASLVAWTDGNDMLEIFARNGSLGARALAVYESEAVSPADSNRTEIVVTTNVVWELADLAVLPSWGLLVLDRTADGGTNTLRLLDAAGNRLVARELPACIGAGGGTMTLGDGFKGFLSEARFWNVLRDDGELLAAKSYVNPRTGTLTGCVRGITKRTSDVTLADEKDALRLWSVTNPVWMNATESGLDLAFTDDGLLRIDRSTVKDLETLVTAESDIQRKLGRLDAGMNPIGLSDGAIPFDITPLGASDGFYTHFEQITDRAKGALKNANTVLDRAQALGSRLRMIQNAESDEEEAASESEQSYKNQLIELYGYPYAGDIGPSGTYVQDYDGPDLVHWMWMDLSPYGLKDVEDKMTDTVVKYEVKGLTSLTVSPIFNSISGTQKNDFSFTISANGLIVKPTTVIGTRRASGRIQQAYGEYLAAYSAWKDATDWYDRQVENLQSGGLSAIASCAVAAVKFGIMSGVAIYQYTQNKAALLARNSLAVVDQAIAGLATGKEAMFQSTPKILGAGFTVNTDPSAITMAAFWSATAPAAAVLNATKTAQQISLNSIEASGVGALLAALFSATEDLAGSVASARATLQTKLDAQLQSAYAVDAAWAKVVNTYAAIDALAAEGERLQEAREAERARLVNRITKLRYNDMFFRQVQNQALTRYRSAFDLAQKYVYLAAQAYDYETGLLASDTASGDAFRAEIVGARSLGQTTDGEPMLGDGVGDAGLSDILARMEANWSVLKGRLGINNPESNATWFSLRRDLFQIAMDAAGDANWRLALAKYRVKDVRSVAEFQRFCQPFASTAGLQAAEPGLVIPFTSTIDFGKNFFGNDLGDEGTALPSSYYTTKIAAAGVLLAGYNAKTAAFSGTAPLSATPEVYLVPAGVDRMRVPGSDGTKILSYRVVDQVVPVPYAIGSTELDSEDWMPTYTGYTGGVDLLARIRKYPAFRASTGTEADAALASTRLTGRSAWNTKWMLVIPAGSLGANRETALDAFIYGKDVDRDGTLDVTGVSDIRLGLRTYSNSGN